MSQIHTEKSQKMDHFLTDFGQKMTPFLSIFWPLFHGFFPISTKKVALFDHFWGHFLSTFFRHTCIVGRFRQTGEKRSGQKCQKRCIFGPPFWPHLDPRDPEIDPFWTTFWTPNSPKSALIWPKTRSKSGPKMIIFRGYPLKSMVSDPLKSTKNGPFLDHFWTKSGSYSIPLF